ncbi:GNAT family N-acetyltransferase [Actinopolymorpha sp. B17G11]|uniref:GNAT family N-acetyltransferase n=1 Tax=unclassified Actinopolymorpha TaxID=2627063 RepID=UPI0032D8F4D5
MLETTERVRLLHAGDLRAVRRVLDADPVTNVFVDARVEAAGSDLRRMGGQLWGFAHRGRLVSLCYSGANLVPVAATSAAASAFAERALRVGRHCSSVWGPRDAVAALWEVLEPSWGAARGVRADQPFLTLRREPAVRPDPLVRRVTIADLGLVYDASVAFFREELGVSPEARDGGAYYRSRVAELVRQGRAYARIEDGEVVFKAEIGVATRRTFQVQGVWVRPERRGEGLAAPGVAAVVAAGLRDVAPVATLYVNDFNLAARRAYARVGFTQASTFMTVLF